MNFKKYISLLAIMTLIFSLVTPMTSNANAFSVEVNDYNYESTEKTLGDTQLVETESELVKPYSPILNPDFTLEETELSRDVEISPMCGPPCGLIAVTVVRGVVGSASRAILKNSAGRTVKTLVPYAV